MYLHSFLNCLLESQCPVSSLCIWRLKQIYTSIIHFKKPNYLQSRQYLEVCRFKLDTVIMYYVYRQSPIKLHQISETCLQTLKVDSDLTWPYWLHLNQSHTHVIHMYMYKKYFNNIFFDCGLLDDYFVL